jgi:GntR family transcriptional regulator
LPKGEVSEDAVMNDDDIQSFELGPIDPADPEPLYRQLRDRLRDMLLEGWPADRPIPSERQLMQITGLSRMTVRQAITELVHEGMLRRDHGRGTFVGDSRIVRPLTGHSSFREIVQREGATPRTRVVRQRLIRANAAQATLLQIEPGESIYVLVRLRSIDDIPVMLDYTSVPFRICPELETADLAGSLYDFLDTICHVPAQYSSDTIEAVAAEGEVAELLDVQPDAPLLLMRRLARTVGNVPLEITDEYVRPDRCVYRVENPSGQAGIDLVGPLAARPVEAV